MSTPVPIDLAPGANVADLTVELDSDGCVASPFCCQDSDEAGFGDDDQALLIEIDAANGGEDQ